jgi:hypothetical protein
MFGRDMFTVEVHLSIPIMKQHAALGLAVEGVALTAVSTGKW